MKERRRQRRWVIPAIYGVVCLFVAAVIALLYGGGFDLSALKLPRLHLPATVRVLPLVALYSFGRMAAAYLLALLFSLSVAYLAVSHRRAGRVILPSLDLLQSVPVLGFFPAAVYLFIQMAQGHAIGVELASIFLIFTAQTWNIAFGIYEAWSTLPAASLEAAEAYNIRGWLRFRTLYWPACLPKLIYNSIASWSAGWYFLIACEIIAIGPLNYELPGLGSFLAKAAEQGDVGLMVAGLCMLLSIVVAMEFLVWRPLSIWATKFRHGPVLASRQSRELFTIEWWSRSPVTRQTRRLFRWARRSVMKFGRRVQRGTVPLWAQLGGPIRLPRVPSPWPVIWWLGAAVVMSVVGVALVMGVRAVVPLAYQPFPAEAGGLPAALGASTLRLLIAYGIALAWTVPVAVLAAEHERVARVVIPLAEIGAAVPATALFPIIVVVVVNYFGDMNVASVLLLLTGMQWYLLFNLVAGAKNLPVHLKETAGALGLSRRLYWRSVLLPAMLPSFITGSITAWGGGWNALIVSEYFIYRGKTYSVTGIGAMLDRAIYESGDGYMIVLALTGMVAMVVLINQLVWQRAYRMAAMRFELDE